MIKSKTFPRLYALASNGKTKWWQVEARSGPLGVRENEAEILVWYGYEGQEDDKIQFTARRVKEGKNLGRANETTAFEQACAEAESMWIKKCDKNYFPTPVKKIVKEARVLLPMLAHDYKKRGHNVKYPAYVQPKLDGVRCLARKLAPGEIEFISRGGKNFETMSHLVPYLDKLMEPGSVFDGELFTPKLTFQQLVSAVKRQKTASPFTPLVHYWIYDCILEDKSFDERFNILSKVLTPDGPVRLVHTFEIENEKELLRHHKQFVKAGFEGAIVRNKAGVYRCDFRSPDLLKYKDMMDEEFTIIGGKEGQGKAEGTVVWTCITEDGKEFDVRPTGTDEQRREWWKNLKSFVGKKLTVKFQNYSDEGVPRFPVAVGIRDYE